MPKESDNLMSSDRDAAVGDRAQADAADAAAALVAQARSIAEGVATQHAEDVDARARFPEETLAALREARLLSAAIPAEFGGRGASLATCAEIAEILGRGCASSGMIFAMHTIQIASIVNHRAKVGELEEYLREAARDERLIASVTSEVGTSGDLRRSIAALTSAGEDEVRFEKASTTCSYCEQADDLLLTLRRSQDAAANDQVAVLARRGEFSLTDIGEWNTLGMRGTCSPPVRVTGAVPTAQVLPDGFREVAALSMVPVSHILWAAVWLGVAGDACDRARRFLRAKSRKDPDGSALAANRLAELSTRLQTLRAHLDLEIRRQEERVLAGDLQAAAETRTVLALNDLKLAVSEGIVGIVADAIQVIGIAAYRNEGEFSLGRHLRDAHSAALMINNDRIRGTNADLLLVYKGR